MFEDNTEDVNRKATERQNADMQLMGKIRNAGEMMELASLLELKTILCKDRLLDDENTEIADALKLVSEEGWKVADALRVIGVVFRRRAYQEITDRGRADSSEKDINNFWKD